LLIVECRRFGAKHLQLGNIDWGDSMLTATLQFTLNNNQSADLVGLPSTGLTPPHVYVCPKPGSGSERWLFGFAHIGECVDHHWLKFLFIIMNLTNRWFKIVAI